MVDSGCLCNMSAWVEISNYYSIQILAWWNMLLCLPPDAASIYFPSIQAVWMHSAYTRMNAFVTLCIFSFLRQLCSWAASDPISLCFLVEMFTFGLEPDQVYITHLPVMIMLWQPWNQAIWFTGYTMLQERWGEMTGIIVLVTQRALDFAVVRSQLWSIL